MGPNPGRAAVFRGAAARMSSSPAKRAREEASEPQGGSKRVGPKPSEVLDFLKICGKLKQTVSGLRLARQNFAMQGLCSSGGCKELCACRFACDGCG